MAQIFAMIVRTLMVKFSQMVSKGWMIISVWSKIRPRLLLFSCMFVHVYQDLNCDTSVHTIEAQMFLIIVRTLMAKFIYILP